MNKSKTKKINYLEIIYILLLITLILLLVILPKNSISSFYDGIKIWATKILPSLLPFFILTQLLSSTPIIPYLEKKISPITKKMYGVGGSSGYIYIMSIISGYPVGAKITSDLYESGKISKSEAISITSFTSTSGPLFILGTVAVGMLGNIKLGVIILFSHYIGALLNGLIYRCRKNIQTNNIVTIQSSNTSSIIWSSIQSVLNIGAYVSLFYMIINLLLSLNIFSPLAKILSYIGVSSEITYGVLSGLIEVTTGQLLLAKSNLSIKLITILSTSIISFGGLSIHAQAYSYLQKFDMPYSLFLLQKLTHAILSTIIATLIILVF